MAISRADGLVRGSKDPPTPPPYLVILLRVEPRNTPETDMIIDDVGVINDPSRRCHIDDVGVMNDPSGRWGGCQEVHLEAGMRPYGQIRYE